MLDHRMFYHWFKECISFFFSLLDAHREREFPEGIREAIKGTNVVGRSLSRSWYDTQLGRRGPVKGKFIMVAGYQLLRV